ncbi:Hypothetical predicted protein [Marmota monax]|uniref:Uncharacterized protein n=1 Tax=Marmota monax TaxID=9995 RepID=A0A5E4AJ12_MARMO|nr:hypothetical protein GHT09_000441 [Marmota monax]VTJ56950.1 Hypothetical predicted protein [Marmota monax]
MDSCSFRADAGWSSEGFLFRLSPSPSSSSSQEQQDLNYNELQEFPVAIRTLGRLQELGFHNNNIKAIPEKAFMGNPLLQTMSLNGATDIQEFPDLKGTSSLEVLTLTRAGIRLLPPEMCQQLPRLRVL